VWFLYVVAWIILAALSLFPVYTVTLDQPSGEGSVFYEATVRLGGGGSTSEMDAADPDGRTTLIRLEGVNRSEGQIQFAVAVGLFLFAVPRSRWSRGLMILAALSWLTGLTQLRQGYDSALGGDPLREFVHIEWQAGFWVLVAFGIFLAAAVVTSYRKGSASGDPS
jgi:hypothetical protein